MVQHVDEVGAADAGAARPRPHRELVAKSAAGRLTHPGHVQVFTQHRRHLDVEVVERHDAIEPLVPGQECGALPDIALRHVPPDEVEGIDGVAGPVRVAQLVVGEQEDATPLSPALPQELVTFSIRRDAQYGQGHGQTR